jgi:hypothetical protein
MTDDNETPLRGDAAWQAAKRKVAEHNEAAYARGREQRADVAEKARQGERAAERREAESLPDQPGRD